MTQNLAPPWWRTSLRYKANLWLKKANLWLKRAKIGLYKNQLQLISNSKILGLNPFIHAVLLAGVSFALLYFYFTAQHFLAAFFLISIAIAYSMFRIVHVYLINSYRTQIKALTCKLNIYQESIKATPYAIAIYDAKNVLIDYNNAYQQIHHEAFAQNNKIINYADLMRATANQFVPENETEQWVAERVATQRNGDGSYVDRLYPDGRWLRVSKHKTPCEAVVGYGIDITQLKQRELELDDSKKRYAALTQITPAGIWQLSQKGETIYHKLTFFNNLD